MKYYLLVILALIAVFNRAVAGDAEFGGVLKSISKSIDGVYELTIDIEKPDFSGLGLNGCADVRLRVGQFSVLKWSVLGALLPIKKPSSRLKHEQFYDFVQKRITRKMYFTPLDKLKKINQSMYFVDGVSYGEYNGVPWVDIYYLPSAK